MGVVAVFALAALSFTGYSATASPQRAAAVTVARHDGVPGGRIVFRQFLNSDQTEGALFIINPDGTHKTQLTHPLSNEVDAQPDWSPDGSKIVFAKFSGIGTDSETHQIFVIDSDGAHERALTHGKSTASRGSFNDQPAFSPNGRWVAYAHGDGDPAADQLRNTGLYAVNVFGGRPHRVFALAPFAGDVGGVVWSPDGKQLLYGVSNSASGTPAGGRAFFLIRANGTHNRQFTKWDSGSDGTPDWSVATNEIVFRVAPDESSGVGNFFEVRPDGTRLKQITHLTDTVVSHKVGFSPDGKWIVYSAAGADGVNHLAIVSTYGTRTRALPTGDAASSAADWSPAP